MKQRSRNNKNRQLRSKKPPRPATAERIAREANRRRVFKWAMAGAGVLLLMRFFAQGIAKFVIRPLDSPGTLHPLLVPYFWPRWPGKPLTREAWVAWCMEALLIPIALALVNLLVPRLRQWWWKWPT